MQVSNVIPFPPSRRLVAEATPHAWIVSPYKFVIQDKMDISCWEMRGGSPSIGRIALHEDTGDAEETADLALVYASGSVWAGWGLARRGCDILLWRCCDGADLGVFAGMSQALRAIGQHVAARRPPTMGGLACFKTARALPCPPEGDSRPLHPWLD